MCIVSWGESGSNHITYSHSIINYLSHSHDIPVLYVLSLYIVSLCRSFSSVRIWFERRKVANGTEYTLLYDTIAQFVSIDWCWYSLISCSLLSESFPPYAVRTVQMFWWFLIMLIAEIDTVECINKQVTYL